LILYPEFLGELKAAGLGLFAQAPAMVRIINLLGQASDETPFQPEQLLAASLAADERDYLVKLLTKNQPFEFGGGDDYARGMCDSLIGWMQSELQKRTSADLQQQIQEAERLGNISLRDELVAWLLSVQRKRTGADFL
jgi:hypothetical protein